MDLGNVEAEGTLYRGSAIFKTFLKPTLCTMLVAVKSTQIIIAIKFVNLVLRYSLMMMLRKIPHNVKSMVTTGICP